jgi:hypothetical protein
MTELTVGTVLKSEDGQTYWQLQEVQRTFAVRMRPVHGGDDPTDVEDAQYPEAALARKIENGELELVETAATETDGGDMKTCAECGETFDTDRGLSTHAGMVHGDDN